MCGIAGGVWTSGQQFGVEATRAALSQIAHRGPDDSGIFSDQLAGSLLCLGHNRLSIIDLTERGHQPMFLMDGRLGITYNGEVYNYKELRNELTAEGWSFDGGTDTEVVLKCWAAWGEDCLQRLEGMFSFVIFDRHANKLTCVRDAFGIKPFFYSNARGDFVFASELPAILSLMRTRPEPDLTSAYAYLVHGEYDNTERSFVRGVHHLPPGCIIDVDLHTGAVTSPKRWWRAGSDSLSSLSFSDAADMVRQTFLGSIKRHLRSDVPLGAALSGGVDSSAVVCAMHHVAPDHPIHAFSFIADDDQLSEEPWVDIVSKAVGATTYKVRATAHEFERDLDMMVSAQGEPFGTTSVYAQFRVFKLASENGITVTFDGQGADELLAGYTGYAGHRILSLLEERDLSRALRFLRNWSHWPGRSFSRGVAEFGRVVLPDSAQALLRSWSGRKSRPSWISDELLSADGIRFNEYRPTRSREYAGRRVTEFLAHSLQIRGIPHLLRHADRNAMTFSIESRVPFLTVPLANLLLSLPESYLISDSGETKSVFRAAMRGIVPDQILDRRDKIGFATPEEAWFRQIMPELRQWLEDADLVPFLHRESIINKFDNMMSGRSVFSWQVWRWVNYIRWYRQTIVASCA